MTQTIEQLQAKVAELTSNVSKWASLAEANQQVAESAQRRADKLAAENARLKAESRDACLGLNDYYGRKLAAAQEECEFQRNAHKQAEELMLEQSKQLAAAQEEILIERSNGDHWRDAYSKWVNTDESARRLIELQEQLAKAEQRVAEAIAEFLESLAWRVKPVSANEAAIEIRSGEWRKFVKEV